ncbi:endonuclease/exonuclease/phosphatase family protein [Minwuia sp.]|uniref:endonuclease/exonuclease/phosphatase family protein n=1 Tax=Minwuia sp. TaxID=2493630 RepID=UPI003A939AE4
MKKILSGIACLLLLLTLGSVFLESIWVFDLIASGRLQYLVALAGLGLVAAISGARAAALILVTAALINGWFVAVYVLKTPPALVEGEQRISVTFHNVKQLVPDLAALRNFVETTETDVLAFTELRAGDAPAVRAAFTDFPHTAGEPGEYSIVLLSRLPLSTARVHRLDDDGPSGTTLEVRVCAEGDARCIALVALHPAPPFNPGYHTHRNIHVWATANLASRIAAEPSIDGRIAMIGDFNFTPWNVIYKETLVLSGLRDAMVQTWPHSTFHSRTAVAGLALDHIWVGEKTGLVQSHIGPKARSDHFAINAQLAIDFEPTR